LGSRSDADLAWETGLLRHLDHAGLTVPVPIPATDGRLFADGLVVMTYVAGGPPETQADWRRMADTLRRLHRLTRGWPQRPGWRSSTDLLYAETGTKIDLGAMPAEGVARCRAAWTRLVGGQTCVVPGKPPSAGTTTTPSSGLPKFDRSEQRQRIEAAPDTSPWRRRTHPHPPLAQPHRRPAARLPLDRGLLQPTPTTLQPQLLDTTEYELGYRKLTELAV
jgi:hypothetical protein